MPATTVEGQIVPPEHDPAVPSYAPAQVSVPQSSNGISAAKIIFWLIVPLALASAASVLIEALISDKPIDHVSLRLNNAFGVGAQALLDTVRAWTGGGWLQDDSWAPMLRALQHLGTDPQSPLYQKLFFAEHTKFQYPPTSLLPLELVGTILPLTSTVLDVISSLLLLANGVLVALLAQMLLADSSKQTPAGRAVSGTPDSRLVALAAFGAAFLFYPLTFAYSLGQIQVWIDFAFTAACLLWLTERRAAAGVFIGLASLIKPQLGLLILWAMAWKEWRFAGGFLAIALPAALISLWRYGWDNHLDYLNVLSYISQHGEVFYRNNSVNGLLNRLVSGSGIEWDPNSFAPYSPFVHAATMAASIAFVLLPLSIPFLQRRSANFFDFGAAALCFTLASPVAWEHHYGIMLPLFVAMLGYLLQDASAESRRPALVLLILSWVLSAGTYGALKLLGEPPLNLLQSHLFFGALLLLALLLRAASQVSATPASDPRGSMRFGL